MQKILLIISREFFVRVKSKQFIIFTLLGPFLISLMFIVPALLVMFGGESSDTIWVKDESGIIADSLKSKKGITFLKMADPLDSLKVRLGTGDGGILYIPKEFSVENPKGIQYFSDNPMGISSQSYLERNIVKVVENQRLQASGLRKSLIDSLKADINITTQKITGDGEKTSTGASTGIGYFAGIIMYMFIFLYGMQVLRGVVEEKTSRIMEVMISSVKPFQLMMGKIFGIAAVGLLQFVLWIILSFGLITIATAAMGISSDPQDAQEMVDMGQNMSSANPTSNMASDLMAEVATLNLPLIITTFLFYFIFGYLLYAALFAAIGSAVDNETDTQQLLFPVTIPIIISFVVAQIVVQNPKTPLAFWFSIIPLTSPIVMMVRIPFGVPPLELALSMILLVAGFVGVTYLAAKIYKVGVLMYGKKPTLKEIGKWMFYKN